MRLALAKLFASFALAVVVLAAPSLAREVVLVENGVSIAPIVIFEGAPRFTRQAADELAEYIERTSGARPDVIEGAPDPVPDTAIWIGYQPVLNDLFPNLDFDFQHPEEILIAAGEHHLVIAGRDRWYPGRQRVALRRETVDGVQKEYGTVNAVYTFLQDYLGVRWLWPGDLGTDVAERDTIAFTPFEFRYHPQIRGRSGIFAFSQLGNRGYGRSHEWTRLQRVQLSSLQFGGGHGFSDWWERFHETNPEFFALQPDGSRGGGDEPWPSARTVKMCKSNPALWEQWLDDVEAQLERNPHQQVFNASANDSWASGYCVCENCRAWDHPDGELRRFRWQGLSQDYVAMSDRQVTFANQLGRGLRRRFPDRDDLYVSMMAYGHSIPAPVEAVPDDNVLVAIVASFHNRKWTGRVGSSEPAAEHLERFKAWGAVAPNLAWRPNLGFGIWEQGLPRVAMDKVIEDFRLAAEKNTIGVFFDSVWEHWAGHGPHYYMLAQMAWNPYADGQAILKDYYQRGFGEAADEIEAYWTLMQETTRVFVENDEGAALEGGMLEIFNEAFFEKAYGCLDRATEAVAGSLEKYRERVEFVRMGLDHTQSMMRARELMERFRRSDGQDTEAENEARRIWVEEIHPRATDERFPQAINWGPLRPGHGRSLGGLYPEDLHLKWQRF